MFLYLCQTSNLRLLSMKRFRVLEVSRVCSGVSSGSVRNAPSGGRGPFIEPEHRHKQDYNQSDVFPAHPQQSTDRKIDASGER